MAVIKVGGVECNVPIKDELSEFNFHNAKWKEDKLISSSPFRDDQAPSFFVNFSTGGWGDSGGVGEWSSGNFVKLLSFLREETYEETVEYLQAMYSMYDIKEGTKLTLPELSLKGDNGMRFIPDMVLDNFTDNYKYLESRGISKSTQELYGTKYDDKHKAVVFPWRLPDGRIANMKYRKVDDKIFWYEKGATPVNSILYGIDLVYEDNIKEVFVTEAEVDALSAYELYGTVGIALGSASASDEQLNLIRKSPIETINIATDMDKMGNKVAGKLTDELSNELNVRRLVFDEGCKDLNDQLILESEKKI